MNRNAIRSATKLAAVLLVGVVAFAVAEAALGPRASQIPTVVTATTSVRPVPAVAATVTPPTSAAVATPTPPPAKPANASTSEHEREVVKPAVRDDGDGDEDGSKPSDGDGDESSSGKTTAVKNSPTITKPTTTELTVRISQTIRTQGTSDPGQSTSELKSSSKHTQFDASHGGSPDTHESSSGKNMNETSH